MGFPVAHRTKIYEAMAGMINFYYKPSRIEKRTKKKKGKKEKKKKKKKIERQRQRDIHTVRRKGALNLK